MKDKEFLIYVSSLTFNSCFTKGKGRNPMVKMPSKDSGYSIESKGSSQSNGKDTPRDEGDTDSLDSDSNPRKPDSGTGSLSQEFLSFLAPEVSFVSLATPVLFFRCPGFHF
jgi:hypothetical protein